MSDDAFDGIRKLTLLYLAYSSIQIISHFTFRDLNHVNTLHIQGNMLTGIHWISFQMFTNLLTLQCDSYLCAAL